MKRLIKKAFGMKLYHGTTLENLELITQSQMIMPQENGGAGLSAGNSHDATQRAFNRLYEDGIKPDSPEYEQSFEKYYEEEMDKERATFEGFTFFTDKQYIAKDYSNSTPQVVIEVSLPEDSLMPDDNDCPDCVDWQDSLNRVKQVKVLGPITEDYITGVHFFDEKGENTFYPKWTWKEQYQSQE